MKPLGYSALIRLSLLAGAIDNGLDVSGLLAGRERDLWMRCVTRKRRIEFLGGRIAGKLAANVCRMAASMSPRPWNAIEIYPQENGAPLCKYDDGSSQRISISHSRNWAMALACPYDQAVAIDVEDPGSCIRLQGDMFHEVELSGIRDLAEARVIWTLKEVCGKLTERGLQGRPNEIIAVKLFDRLWLASPPWMNVSPSTILAAGYCGPLAVAVGFESDTGKRVDSHQICERI
jgi:phosphopantetheinyl transferase (holo-ACP synthase)